MTGSPIETLKTAVYEAYSALGRRRVKGEILQLTYPWYADALQEASTNGYEGPPRTSWA